tara:strand:+ start:83 stop:625 length:543 start_codon:yes stop_codon:yes gene_type:complete
MASTGIKQEMNNLKYTQADLDKEIQGKRAVANHLNNTKYNLAVEQKKTQQLYNMIMKSNDYDMIEDMLLNTIGIQVPVRYYAIKSTYKNKKGKKTKCWRSAYGKYVGKRNDKINETDIPILTGYKYYTEEDFIITLMGKGNPAEIECSDTYTLIHKRRVQIVEECVEIDTGYDTEEVEEK